MSRLHWDLTSIWLYGAYPQADQDYPAPRWGHPEDRRPDLKQIQTGLAVSGDGGIPVFHHAYDGGAAEVAQVAGAMTALRQIAGPRRFLLAGDSKLISCINAAAMGAQGVGFVAPLAAARVPAGLFAALPPGADQDAIDAEAAADGWYAPLTNLEPGQAGPAEVFRHKGQPAVERRYGEFKGPLAVAPLFLKTNRRITALITVICLALLIVRSRAAGPATPWPRTARCDRPARLRPCPRPPHRQDHLPRPGRPAPDPAHDGNPAQSLNPPASRPGCWTSSTSTSADPAGSTRKTPCAKTGASVPVLSSVL